MNHPGFREGSIQHRAIAMNDSDSVIFLLAGRMQRRKRRARAAWGGAARAASNTLNPALDRAPAMSCRSPAQRVGDQGEDQALALLTARGLHMLARNLSCPLGEIDLAMRDGDVLVFVEVRARRSKRYGGAAASIGPAKRRRLRRAARFFLPMLARQYWHGIEPRCRFDVVALEPDGPVWLPAALDAQV